MDALEYIKQNVKIIDVMKMYNFQSITEQGTLIRSCCGIHKGDNHTAFVYNTENDLWYCHTKCGGGNVINLIMALEGLTFYYAIQFICNTFNINITDMTIDYSKHSVEQDTQKWMALMRSISHIPNYEPFDLETLGDLYNIKEYRNFNQKTLDAFGIKYCNDNKRIVVPIMQTGICVGASMRKTTEHPSKWLHVPKGIKMGEYLYNIDNCTQDDIIITEGCFDAMTYSMYGYTNVVSTFGCHMTEEQLHILLRSTHSIIIAYDNDNAGRKGIRNLIKRLKDKVTLYIANIPDTFDPGSLNESQIHHSITNKLHYTDWGY